MSTLATQLAEWSVALRWEAVPSDLQPLIKLRFLDTLGLMLAALPLPPGQAVRSVALRQGGVAESTLVGGGERVPAAWAALVHGTLAHCLDFDDTFPNSVVHPSSLVVPVALAVGEATGAAGREVLAAAAAGYEVAARMGAAAGRRFHARGFQASGVLGPLVAAAVAGVLYRLPPARVAEAMGLAGSMGGGLLECVTDGTWSKRLHPGWAGHGGIIAAQLAHVGFPGPASVLEGRYGLYNAFLGPEAVDHAGVAEGLGSRWESRAGTFKFYPCAHVIHPFLEEAIALREREGIDPAAIAGLQCRVAPWSVPIVCEPWEEKIAPRTEYQAIASLPFALSAAWIDGRVDSDTFTPAAIRRADLRELAARVTYRVDPDLAAGFAGELIVTTRDGRRFQTRAAATECVDPQRVRAKFAANAGRLLPPERVDALSDAVARLEDIRPAALLALCLSERAPEPAP